MRLEKRFNGSLQCFANGKKAVSSMETFILKFIPNLFTYIEGYEVRVSLYFA